jgi:uncharacterized protein YuzE
MNKKIKPLEGEVDYDYKRDILFFKTKNKEYAQSIEMDNIILDIDTEGLIVGMQLFEASTFLRISKTALREIPHWEFITKVENEGETKIEIRLAFSIKMRNKLVEKNPIIMPSPSSVYLPTSELVCVA